MGRRSDIGSLQTGRKTVGMHEFGTKRFVVWRSVCADEGTVFQFYGNPKGVRWVGDGTPLSSQNARCWMDVTRASYVERSCEMMAVKMRATISFGGIVHPDGGPDPKIRYAFKHPVDDVAPNIPQGCSLGIHRVP